ncbi:MAG: hypothetical protein AAF587_36595 [Bacteroidota bacterium]
MASNIHMVWIFAIMMSGNMLYSQTYKQKYPQGYILSHRGDTTYGFVRLGDNFKDQNKIRFYDQFGVKARYTADRLQGFGYEGKHYVSRQTPYLYSGLFSDTVMFMQRVCDGPAKLFRFFTRKSVFTLKKGPAYVEYLEKPDGSVHEVSLVFKWQRIANAFLDYPELAADIRNDRYKPEDMEKIVDAYNRWFQRHGRTIRKKKK